MYAITIVREEAMDLKGSKEGQTGGFVLKSKK